MSVRNGVVVEKSAEGFRVEGYINDDRFITITNSNFTRKFEVSQCKVVIGAFEKARETNKLITDVLDTVESLRAEHEGKISISVVNRNNNWMISIDGFDGDIEPSRKEAVEVAKHFKTKYEKLGVIVSYSEEEE